MDSVKARWLAATVIPANAGIQGVLARKVKARHQCGWIPARAALGRNDGLPLQLQCDDQPSPGTFHSPLLNPQRSLNLFQRHTFGFRQEL